MHSRCYDTKSHRYHRYGGRGIYVCDEWHSFENYYAFFGDIPKGMSVDRVNNDGPYSPENCRIASYSQQARNRSDTHFICFKGDTRSLTEWAEITGLNRTAIRNRLKRGWLAEDALTIPVTSYGYRIKYHKVKE